MDIGKIGVWFFLDAMSAPESARFAQTVEKAGYRALWIPEAVGREPFPHAAYLLSHTEQLSIATGIANIWARDPITMAAASKTVAELSGGRFVLGIGVSHKPLVANLRGHSYDKPYSYMKEYLPKMKSALYRAPEPKEPVPIVIAGGSRWSEAASDALMRFAGRFDIPVATSFRRTHVMDPLHPSYAGDLASGPNPKLLARVKAADLVLLLGGRLGEWPSQGYTLLDVPVPKQTLIHVHPGIEELGRVYRPHLAIHATPTAFAASLDQIAAPNDIRWRDETKTALVIRRDLAAWQVANVAAFLIESGLLFEEFFRAHETITDAEGTGLGLSIVREAAQSQSGRAWAEHLESGGSVFALALPVRRKEFDIATGLPNHSLQRA